MPAQANMTVTDSSAASKTFTAAGVKNGIATWYEKTASVITGYIRMTFSMKFPTKASEPIRHHMKVVLPTTATETINGVTRNIVTRQSMIDITVVCAPDSTSTERADLMQYAGLMFSGSTNTGVNFRNQVINNDETT